MKNHAHTSKPNIVILDAHTANPGDLSWSPVESLGHLTVHDRTPHSTAEIVARAHQAQIVLTNKTPLNAETLTALAQNGTRYVGVLATGTNIIDLPTASANNITVTNAPGYSTDSVAQHVFALLLELASAVARHDAKVRTTWPGHADFSFTVAPITELAGKTLGVVGLGEIGKKTARIAHALGMKILAYNAGRTNKTIDNPTIDFAWADLDTLFTESDAITLHCPLTPDTEHLINADRLAQMKPSAFLINTGRGPLIDESALADALTNNTIAGAGLDVLSSEPPASDNPLLAAPNCVITPHIAWASREARTRLIQIVADNITAFLDSTPQNKVNP